MKYINNINEYIQLLSSVKNKDIILLPTLSDHELHYVVNKLSFVFIKILDDGKEFYIGIDHPDLFSVTIEQLTKLKANKIYTIDQKKINNILKKNDIIDMNMFSYLLLNNVPEWILVASGHLYYQRKFSSVPNINNIIPITKHIEIHQKNADKIIEILRNFNPPPALLSYRSFVTSASQVEANGIKINPDILKRFYGDTINKYITSDNYIYSEYNFYTSTGRPSNRFGNINFSAIDKKNGIRKAFIPRYDHLLMFDFDSFHLNLIAKMIGYKFETDNIHYHLGSYYFGKKKLSKKEFEEVKQLNFRFLYGGVPDSIKKRIPYFSKVHEFTFDIWKQINKTGYYLSPLSGRKMYIKHIESPSPSKVFNYFIQLLEMETGMVLFDKLLKFLESYKTKLILYTYDAFLFDYSKSDGVECLKGIYDIMNIFSTKIYFGDTYQDLVNITELFTTKIK